MQERPFGGTGRQVPVIGQGTWNLELAPRAQAIAALQRGLDLGLRHIDTAEMYGDGDAESLVGEAIDGRRDEVFLVSKVLPSNASKQGVRSACERSLKRLRTDRLDCYLLHWRGSYPLEETFAAFEDLQRDGKILNFGVSNFDVDDLEEAIDVLGPGRIACNQVLYHLKQRAIEHAVIPWCADNQIAVVAYSPFGQDAFPSPDSTGGRVLAALADAHGATARQIALAFLTRGNDVFAIPKASTADHTEANAGAGDIMLSDDDIIQIDKAFPRGAKPRGLPML